MNMNKDIEFTPEERTSLNTDIASIRRLFPKIDPSRTHKLTIDKESVNYISVYKDAACISNLIKEYPLFIHHSIFITMIISAWVAFAGLIRFLIAIYRRKKGTYPPAASQMEEH